MTINSTTRKAGPFIGNGSAASFPFTFKVFQASDLDVVKLNTSTNAEQTLVLTADYTVTLNQDQDSNPGGTVTLTAGALPSGFTLTMTSDVANLQPTDLTNQGGFYPEVINDSLDRATIQIQQLQEQVDRSIKLPLSSTASSELPFPDPSKLLGWNSNGSALTNFDPASVVSVVGQQNSYADIFTGNGVTTNFTLTRDPGSVFNIDVSIQGVTQAPNVDYILNGTVLSFTTAPPAVNSRILARYSEVYGFSTGDAVNVRYVPAGPGAVTTNVQAKLRETVSVKDFGAVGDGVADDTAAFQAALAAGDTAVYVPNGVYRITSTLSFASVAITGESWGAVIEGDIVSATTPLLRAGRSSAITNIRLRFKSSRITGSETQGQRVLVETYGGTSGLELQRGSLIQRVRTEACGTAFYSPASPNKPAFSVTFDTLEILDFSFRGFDFQSETRTGNVYSNIYIASNNYTPDAGFVLDGEESECVINQLNVEHTACSNAAVVLNNVRALAAGTIHLEGVDVTTPNSAYLKLSSTSGSIESLSIYYTRMSQNNTSCVELGSIVYDDFGTQYDPAVMQFIRFGVFHMKGIAVPGSGYPSYPANRIGLNSTITGFNFISRPAIYVGKTINVQIDSYVWNGDPPNNDASVYQAFPCDPNNNIAFTKKGDYFQQTVDGARFCGPVLYVGNKTNNAHPILFDRDGNSFQPTFTWWFDSNTGLSHPAAGETGMTLNNLDTYRFKSTGFVPTFTNAVSLGAAGNLWTVVYAASGTINTSDGNKKQDIRPLSDKEKAVAVRLKSAIKAFKFKDAVTQKGNDARIHFGVIAQDVKAAFEAEGLVAENYGVFCSDTLEDGSTLLGVRYDELFAFIIGAL